MFGAEISSLWGPTSLRICVGDQRGFSGSSKARKSQKRLGNAMKNCSAKSDKWLKPGVFPLRCTLRKLSGSITSVLHGQKSFYKKKPKPLTFLWSFTITGWGAPKEVGRRKLLMLKQRTFLCLGWCCLNEGIFSLKSWRKTPGGKWRRRRSQDDLEAFQLFKRIVDNINLWQILALKCSSRLSMARFHQ